MTDTRAKIARICMEIATHEADPDDESVPNGEDYYYADRILALLEEGERIEGWIDHDEAPDEGFTVGFWNVGGASDVPMPVGGTRPRRATLILHLATGGAGGRHR